MTDIHTGFSNNESDVVLQRAKARQNSYRVEHDGELLPVAQFYCNANNVDCSAHGGEIRDREFICLNHLPKA